MSEPTPIKDEATKYRELIEQLAVEKDTNVRAMLTEKLRALIMPKRER